ncbi:MAG: serine hydrolase [Pseudobutyrivibrio sp.]|nr:serine hydrolase [Pseudobutyrivibrio sp.]
MKNRMVIRFVAVLATVAMMLISLFNPMIVQAANYVVVPENGVLLTGEGAEVFADADASTLISTLPVNTPVEITGRTTNDFWQVNINGATCYMSKQALSIFPNTTACKLTSFDVAGAIVVDGSNGQVLYSQDAFTTLEPASTTKIMTMLLVVEAIESGQIALDTPVVVSATAVATNPADASHLDPKFQAGEVLNVDQLMSAVMLSSDCLASNVLAELVAGSTENFVAMMNQKAAAIGCVKTNFTNPSGYPDPKMYTNAYSLYLIAANAMQHPLFNQYFGKKSAVIPPTNLCPMTRNITNTDCLLDASSQYYNPYVIGGKTGTTNRAGQCLVAVANKAGKTLISVVLGARNRTLFDGSTVSMRYRETNRLIDFGFASY